MKVYLAGPMTGLTYDEAGGWREDLVPTLAKHDWEVISPMDPDVKPWLEEKFANKAMPSRIPTDKEAQEVRWDLDHIARAHALFVNLLDADRVSVGTIMEMGFAYAHRIPIITVDVPGSVHDHMFVSQCSMVIASDLLEGVWELVKLGTKMKEPQYA